jgi:hypothetical protein
MSVVVAEHASTIPKSAQRNRAHLIARQSKSVRAGVKQHPTLEIVTTLFSQTPQTPPIDRMRGHRALYFDAPCLLTSRYHEIDFNLIFIAIMPKT